MNLMMCDEMQGVDAHEGGEPVMMCERGPAGRSDTQLQFSYFSSDFLGGVQASQPPLELKFFLSEKRCFCRSDEVREGGCCA